MRLAAQGLQVEGIPALFEVGQEHGVIDMTQGVHVTPPHLDRKLEYRGHVPTSLGSTQKLSPGLAAAPTPAPQGRGRSRNAMNPRGSLLRRSYSAGSTPAASGTGRGSSSRSMRNPAAKISSQVVSSGASQ